MARRRGATCDGKVYRQEYERGAPKATWEEVVGKAGDTRTIMLVLPDADVFEEVEFSVETLVAAPARDRRS
jgi:DNA gyrase subunit B